MSEGFKQIGETEKYTCECAEFEWIMYESRFATDDANLNFTTPIFSFANTSWYLQIYPNRCGYILLNLLYEGKPECSVEYNFTLEKGNGTILRSFNGTVETDGFLSDEQCFIQRSKLWPEDFGYSLFNIVNISCTLKHKIIHSIGLLEKKTPLQLIRLDKLSNNFKELYANKETCDTRLQVKDKEYRVHRSVLIARSTVFAANFKHDTLEKQTGVITIPDCDPDSFQKFLEYLYSGKIEEISFRDALNMYYISDKYEVEELKAFCVEYLPQCLSVENLCETVIFADKYDEMKLFATAQDWFNENVHKVFEVSDWESLMKNNCRLANKLLKEMAKLKVKE